MKLLRGFVILFFIFFIVTILLSVSGYYQTELQRKMILTNEAIEEFENDIKNGKDVDAKDYASYNQKNYDNNFSKTGRFISKKINQVVSSGIKKSLKIIMKAIEE